MQRLGEFIERALGSFSQQSETRRAAIVGIGFGLLLCVIVLLICVVLGLVSGLGTSG